jgi:hypothetical protein
MATTAPTFPAKKAERSWHCHIRFLPFATLLALDGCHSDLPLTANVPTAAAAADPARGLSPADVRPEADDAAAALELGVPADEPEGVVDALDVLPPTPDVAPPPVDQLNQDIEQAPEDVDELPADSNQSIEVAPADATSDLASEAAGPDACDSAGCDDSNPCTSDGCVTGACLHQPVSGICSDGNACTLGDQCLAGACKPASFLDCSDGNPCTADSCDMVKGCVHVATAPCAADAGGGDADASDSTSYDTTEAGPAAANSCKAADSGTPCDDASSCTVEDQCVGGDCVGVPIACPDDGDACTTEACVSGQGCVHTGCPFLPNVASAGCGAGCTIGTCAPGWADCNGDVEDGCETDIADSTSHCGGCAIVCPSVGNGAGACVAGSCKVTACAAGHADCDGKGANGCETDLSGDVANCGGCGNACKLKFADHVGCGQGACTVVSCAKAHMDCDGIASNGCEAVPGDCDDSPPAPITTLAAETDLQVQLTWQAVGENGNVGQATRYVIKYATQPITDEAEFAVAQEFAQTLTPKPAGKQDTVQVQGLKPRETYYFVVRAVDKAGNLGLFTTDAAAIAGSFGFVASGCCDGDQSWGDFDGDGDLDLLADGNLARNDGAGVFSAQWQPTGYYSGAYTWLDLDRDGRLDIVGASLAFRNQGDGTFLETPDSWAGNASAWADADNDGDADLLSGDTILRNDGRHVFATAATVDLGETALNAATWADLDADGRLDLVTSAGGGAFWEGWTKTHRNQGGASDGSLSLTVVQKWHWAPIASLACADQDGDGYADILAGVGNVGGASNLLHDQKDGTFASIWTSPVLYEWFDGAAWGDYDGDGDGDFLGVAEGWYEGKYKNEPPPDTLSLYRNEGGNKFTHPLASLAASGEGIAWADFDGDGDLDFSAGGAIYRSYEAEFYGGNVPPSPPTSGFSSAFDAGSRTLTIQFGAGLDPDPDGKGPLGATPALGLYYDIAIGTAPGKGDVVSPAYGSPLLGNHGQMWIGAGKHGFALHDPPAGKLCWRVHAIDAGLAAGPWSPEQSAFVTTSWRDGWPGMALKADTTGENVHELQYVDGIGSAPKAFVSGDGWYTVLPSETLTIAGFRPPWQSGTVVSLSLQVRYTVGAKYDGTTAIRWGFAGGPLQDTTMVPAAGDGDALATFDLVKAGVTTAAQVKSLVVAFTNGSGSGTQRELSVDSVRVEVVVKP